MKRVEDVDFQNEMFETRSQACRGLAREDEARLGELAREGSERYSMGLEDAAAERLLIQESKTAMAWRRWVAEEADHGERLLSILRAQVERLEAVRWGAMQEAKENLVLFDEITALRRRPERPRWDRT